MNKYNEFLDEYLILRRQYDSGYLKGAELREYDKADKIINRLEYINNDDFILFLKKALSYNKEVFKVIVDDPDYPERYVDGYYVPGYKIAKFRDAFAGGGN